MTADTDISSLAHDADPAAKKAFNANVLAQFRANHGQIISGPLAGLPSLILHTVGAKSGNPVETPLFRFDHNDRRYVIAAFAGSPVNPAWAHNLWAHPSVVVEVADETYDATARELPRQERDALWPFLIEQNPSFTDYQEQTKRTIPIFELQRSTA
ncbi:nitroreductase/quinone reductase family protein [Mycobacterium sp. MUNTM1]